MREAEIQLSLFEDNPEYDDFVNKFKPKKTTDDCYTPENIYESVATWVVREYGVSRDSFVRPFWPDTDYETFDYPEDCVVVDNPPFSLRAAILRFYREKGIQFFLFAPALMLLSTYYDNFTYIATGVNITYENGAEVPTSFITNLQPGVCLRTAPDLYEDISAADLENLRKGKKQLPKYIYPDEVVTAAIAQRWCRYGIDYSLCRDDAVFIRALDAQRKVGKTIFGGGLLISERAAAERTAAERWQLSDRERRLAAGVEAAK